MHWIVFVSPPVRDGPSSELNKTRFEVFADLAYCPLPLTLRPTKKDVKISFGPGV